MSTTTRKGHKKAADAEMAAKKREEKLKKAEKSTKNNAYGIVHGKDRYIKEETILKETGEVLDERQTAKVSAVDREKAEKDALYDGYFAIITSEMDYDAAKIREVYHGLWRIEESFRIMKSDFDARPIYLNKREHIRAHFLICFVALVILRLIQNRMGIERLSVDRIAEAQTACWKEAVMSACWMLVERSGTRKSQIGKVGNWCQA